VTGPATHHGTPDSGARPPQGSDRCSLPAAAADSRINYAIFRVARLHHMIAGQLLRRVGLHPGQESVMMQLWDTGPQRQADLIRVLESDAATMARSVCRLEQAGFVRRRPDPTDRRASIIEPTPASLALREQVKQCWRQLEQLTVGDLSPDDQVAALQILDRIEHNLLRAADADEGTGQE